MSRRTTLSILAVGCALLAASGCTRFVLRTVVGTVDPYFHGDGIDGTRFERLSDHVYTFRWNWYRNVVVVTSDGLVVIDPMNPQMAAALRQELKRVLPGRPVHTLVYSHYHLDHTRGGAVLEPGQIIAHAKCPAYWQAADAHDVLAPTRLISGDTILRVGDVDIQALYLGSSHTDTLYAFHIPADRLVFTADLGLVKAVEPDGVPDRYAPGYLAALNRVIDLDFDIFVPSHFGVGTRRDIIDWRDMLEDGRRLARQAIASTGTPGAQDDQMTRYFDLIYDPMQEKYGSWHGFDEMFVLNFVRSVVGESLGY